jgi:hypothetical protein
VARLLAPQRARFASGSQEVTIFSVVVAASPPQQRKETVPSALPEAKTGGRGRHRVRRGNDLCWRLRRSRNRKHKGVTL